MDTDKLKSDFHKWAFDQRDIQGGEPLLKITDWLVERMESEIQAATQKGREEVVREIDVKIGKWFDEEWNPDLERIGLYGSPTGTRAFITQKELLIEAVKEYLLTPQEDNTTGRHDFDMKTNQDHDEVYTCKKCGHVITLKHAIASNSSLTDLAFKGCKEDNKQL